MIVYIAVTRGYCRVRYSFDCLLFFFKQKTAYEMRISDWSSDVCSSDLPPLAVQHRFRNRVRQRQRLFDPGDQRQDDEEVREIISGSKLADPHIGLFRRRAAAIAQDQDVDDEKPAEIGRAHV